MLTITGSRLSVSLNETNHIFTVKTPAAEWIIPECGRIAFCGAFAAAADSAPSRTASVTTVTSEASAASDASAVFADASGTQEHSCSFLDAAEITREVFTTGIGPGLRLVYKNLAGTGFTFETLIRIESATDDVYFEFVPLTEPHTVKIKKVHWPEAASFEECKSDNVTVLPLRQGLLIPNNWPNALNQLVFDGQYQTAGCFMPWFGQIRKRAGYIAISETPWDGGVTIDHPAGGPYTHVSQWLIPSLGRMRYRRVLRYSFLDGCDFNDLCKTYRRYVNEIGLLRTLAEKAARNPSVRELEKCSFVHTGVKTHVQPDSEFYDPAKPDANNHLHTFAERTQMIRDLHAAGAGKIYLHLDGWAAPGYDNNHPDYNEVCEEAGGISGMKELAATLQDAGDLFGIHDQYRDYYKRAASFDANYAIQNEDGTNPGHARWAGGPQSYLCSTQAPYYVKRNFEKLKASGIRLDGAYLDVFTCNEADECFNPEHRASRRDCYEFRGRCFEYLLSQGILASSEEASDWAIPSLVFCHYAPYEFQMMPPGSPEPGIAVPLFNLVYHDCLIQPQLMEQYENGRDDMLYALLDGQPPYLVRDPAYENIDGSFASAVIPPEQQAARCKVVSDFATAVAEQEMTRFEFLNDKRTAARSSFANGKSVTVDFRSGTFEIH